MMMSSHSFMMMMSRASSPQVQADLFYFHRNLWKPPKNEIHQKVESRGLNVLLPMYLKQLVVERVTLDL